MSTVDFTTNASVSKLDADAASLAEAGWTKVGLKVGQDPGSYTSGKMALLHSYVSARLLVRNPGTSLAVIQSATDYGVAQAAATLGVSTPTLTPAAAVGGVLTGGLPGPVSAAESAAKSAESVATFLGVLGEASTWYRATYIVGGSVLVLSGLFIIAKELGANAPTPPIMLAAKPFRIAHNRARPHYERAVNP